MNKFKLLGQVYTPTWIVRIILDEANYSGHHILGKTVLEPACGDGAFLTEIVRRYIQAAKQENLPTYKIISDLETYIYGIEKDPTAYQQCLTNLNKLIQKELTSCTLNWKIFCDDTLIKYQDYLKSFDFIFGNPPYIRIHNLDRQTRILIKEKMQFTNGMLDIYISFFEMALQMLKTNGVLGFITPNTFLHNTSYQNFRKFLQKKQNIKMICDFQSNKIFDGFSTYTAITIIDQSQQQQNFTYKEKSKQKQKINSVNQINFTDLNSQKWTLSNHENSNFLNTLFSTSNTQMKELFNIQYGFATLRDKIFIASATNKTDTHIQLNGHWLERKILRKIIKGSCYKGDKNQIEYIIFPYHKKNGKYHAYTENELMKDFPLTYLYLLENKDELLKRDLDKNTLWYEFGRSQGIQTSHTPKIVISTMINDSINFFRLPKEILVYSGIFLSAKYDEHDLSLAEQILKSPEFFRYTRLTGKDFSGGYKSLSTKQIKEYPISIPKPHSLF
ncbi:MAG: Eco57I restriction-modification methylase domain-containing protein [Neisseria sp.]|nr:Eco57I restriction-modification methylase domain-containing protein [Neisseria sp.]